MRIFLKIVCGYTVLLGLFVLLVSLSIRLGNRELSAVGFVIFLIGFIPLVVMIKNDNRKKREEKLNQKIYEENYRNSIYRNVPYIDKKSYKFFCPICGTKLSRDMIYCHKCSYKVVLRKEYFNVPKDLLLDDKCANLYYSSDYYKCTKYNYYQVRQDKGMWGEYYLEGIINGAYGGPHLGFDNRLLFNLLIPERNGLFQEIDALAIVDGVIFVFEVKNRDGIIEIPSLSSKVWSQHIGKQVHEIHSPIWQNEQHILALKQFIFDKLGKTDIPIINYVVFPDGNIYVKNSISSDGKYVQNTVVDGCIIKVNIQPIDIDRVQLSPCTRVLQYSELQTCIHNDMFEFIKMRQEFNSDNLVNSESHNLNLFSDVTVEQLYNILEPYAHIDAEMKIMYMQERMARIDETNKCSEFKYGFIGIKELKSIAGSIAYMCPYFVRTNNVYWQKCCEKNGMCDWIIMGKEEIELIKKIHIIWIDSNKYSTKLVDAWYHFRLGADFTMSVDGILDKVESYSRLNFEDNN